MNTPLAELKKKLLYMAPSAPECVKRRDLCRHESTYTPTLLAPLDSNEIARAINTIYSSADKRMRGEHHCHDHDELYGGWTDG